MAAAGHPTPLLRLWAGFMATGLQRHAAGMAGLPLVVILDCKGGADARHIAERPRRVRAPAAAGHIALGQQAVANTDFARRLDVSQSAYTYLGRGPA